MKKSIYKSATGRQLVEKHYSDILAGYPDFPYIQHYVATALGKTHVLQFGQKDKPALVLIHGTMSNSAGWLGSIKYFIDDFSVYCVDLPGEPGLSSPERMRLDSEEPYVWLDQVLDGLNISCCAFLTMSLGSWYAINYSVHNPQRVVAHSMLTTSGIVKPGTSFIFKAIFFLLLGKKGQQKLNQAIYYKTKVPDAVLDFQSLVSSHVRPMMEPIPIFSSDALKNILSPVQFFGGEKDALLNTIKTAQRLKETIPVAEINVLPETGHVIIDRFEAIRSFLLRNIDNRE